MIRYPIALRVYLMCWMPRIFNVFCEYISDIGELNRFFVKYGAL